MPAEALATAIEDFLTAHPPVLTLLVAVSGGPDSLALLHSLLAARNAHPAMRLEVAHLDHSIRGIASQEDARFVEQYCQANGLPCHLARCDVPAFAQLAGLSLEDAARQARYSFLHHLARQRRLPLVLTGHTADDQAETVLMRLLRGTGPDGLAGIADFSPLPPPDKRLLDHFPLMPPTPDLAIMVARPLLSIWRSDIEAYCRLHRLQPRQDKTNQELVYRRNRIRRELLPALEKEYSPAMRAHLVNLAQLVRQDHVWLAELAETAFKVHARITPYSITFDHSYFQQAPAALQGRLLRLGAARLEASHNLNMVHIRAALALFHTAASAASIDLPNNLQAFTTPQRVGLRRKADRFLAGFTPAALPVPGQLTGPLDCWRITAAVFKTGALQPEFSDNYRVWLDYDKIGPDLVVRPRRPGERFQPLGAPGRRKVQDIMVDAHLPRELRAGWPLVSRPDGTPVWLPGITIAHECRINSDTATLVELKFESDLIQSLLSSYQKEN